MSQPSRGDLEARVARLEEQIEQIRADYRARIAVVGSDAAAARVLASGADRDVAELRAELRAHLQVLNALRETQIEQGAEIHELRAEMREGFTKLGLGMAQITALLSGIAEAD